MPIRLGEQILNELKVIDVQQTNKLSFYWLTSMASVLRYVSRSEHEMNRRL